MTQNAKLPSSLQADGFVFPVAGSVETTTSTESSADPTGDQRPSTPLEVLIAARKLIEKPENWLNRHPTASDERSGKFCAARSLWVQSERGFAEYGLCNKAYFALSNEIGGSQSLVSFNDSHSHAEVLAVFDAAIAKAMGAAQ